MCSMLMLQPTSFASFSEGDALHQCSAPPTPPDRPDVVLFISLSSKICKFFRCMLTFGCAVTSPSSSGTRLLAENPFHGLLVLYGWKQNSKSKQWPETATQNNHLLFIIHTFINSHVFALPFRNSSHILPLLCPLPSHRVYRHCC